MRDSLLFPIIYSRKTARIDFSAAIMNHRGTEFTETLSIPFHPSLKSPHNCFGIVVSVRSSSVRSATLRFYSR